MNGLFGRQSGTTAGYSYSAANKNMAVVWEETTLYDYLLNPKKVSTFDPLLVAVYCFACFRLSIFLAKTILHTSLCMPWINMALMPYMNKDPIDNSIRTSDAWASVFSEYPATLCVGMTHHRCSRQMVVGLG